MKKVVNAIMAKKVNRRGRPIAKKAVPKKKKPPSKPMPKRGTRYA